MAFLHPDYFPFCPKIGFDPPRLGLNRTNFQGPFSLEEAMALYWKVKTISISGTQFSAFGPLSFSFTFSSPSKMSDVICPDITTFGPSIPIWGWTDSQNHSPEWNAVQFTSSLQAGLASFQKNGNIVYSDGAYYVFFRLILFPSEGSPVRSTSESIGDQTLDTTVNLQIDDLSLPIGFHIIDTPFSPEYVSIISSFTCTLRDPS